MTEALVLPVGQLVGTYHDPADAGGHHHEVRVGGQIHELTDTELVTWVSAHAAPDDRVDDGPWTTAALLRQLTTQGVPRPAALVDTLFDRRLLTEVVPGGDGAVTFARAHRVVPTMLGLGNLPDQPWLYAIGLMGQERIRVSRLVFELWAWGHLDENLWHACDALAALEKADGEVAGPAEVLEGFLHTLHGLLNAQAAYLDTVERA
ncbi:hypothetical protein GCM10009557_21340 [Virgisporangium ochraceum]|uniref:Uncharacterized protein n=1 Tax=Virgisporangium ochraceum TaxID=65505 RepID=A0A8J4EAN8_9ACTN|nr:hypothetical protein [Virgisporangium ochraceum]GIJ67886.1 hypothetical protein Voc01_028030 [Virgisporangium ochraceum]